VFLPEGGCRCVSRQSCSNLNERRQGGAGVNHGHSQKRADNASRPAASARLGPGRGSRPCSGE
jgi:hypothetical protein